MRKHRMGLLALVLIALLPLGACTSLPTASAPAPFEVSTPSTDPIELSADGPAKDSDAATLVADFLLACAAGTNDDFATARLFLSSRSAQRWAPVKQILIYDTASRPTVSVDSSSGPTHASVTVAALAVASVNEHGVLTRAQDSSIIENFDLVRENGQWRIDAPGDFFIVSQASFLASYQRIFLYFPASTGDALVPDPRWYPSRRLATYLLAGLVDGPVASLSGAVTNAIPAGTTIPSQSVEIVERTARVALDATLPSSVTERSLIVWEVTKTLLQDPSISEVRLEISDVDLSELPTPSGPSYSLDMRVGMSEGSIGMMSAAKIAPLALPVQPEDGALSPAISPTSSGLVAWREGSTLVIVQGEASHTVNVGAVGAPSLDRFGYVWTITNAKVQAITGGGQVTDVPLSQEVGMWRVVISPDGARALLMRRTTEGATVLLASVERDGAGVPTGFSGLETIGELGAAVHDVSWVGEDSFVAIRTKSAGSAGEGLELVSVDLGGLIEVTSVPDGASSVSAGSHEENVCVRTSSGSVHCRAGALWQDMPADITEVRFPG